MVPTSNGHVQTKTHTSSRIRVAALSWLAHDLNACAREIGAIVPSRNHVTTMLLHTFAHYYDKQKGSCHLGRSDDTVVNRATRKKNEHYKRSSLLGARRIIPDDGGAQQLIHSEIIFVAACRFFYRARHLYFCLIQDDSVNLLIARTTSLWRPLLKTT